MDKSHRLPTIDEKISALKHTRTEVRTDISVYKSLLNDKEHFEKLLNKEIAKLERIKEEQSPTPPSTGAEGD